MLELFSNPGYLAAGGALVSAPVVIHLINRMRFRRVRWAAMEFLLKSQKRNRRRLIIEQLLLLFLRCLLVLMTALLVLRFVGFSLGDFQNQDGLHVLVLDDTLSMTDRVPDGEESNSTFAMAKEKTILKGLLPTIAQSTTNERLAIVPLSRLITDPNYQPKIYQRLADPDTIKEITEELESLKPSYLHVPISLGVKHAQTIFFPKDEAPRFRPTLHIISDFRRVDWSEPYADELKKLMDSLEKNSVTVRLSDVAFPARDLALEDTPNGHENVGIVDFRANTRIVGKGMPVTFTVDVANYGVTEKKVTVLIYESTPSDQNALGQVSKIDTQERQDVDFTPRMPLEIKPGSVASASFELRLFPSIDPKTKFYSQKLTAKVLSAQRTELEGDGVSGDNIRHASVEVREKVPVLVVDGAGRKGREESKDSFFIENAIISVPGGSYEIVYGDEIASGNPLKALESTDLSKYPTIILLNVPQLNQKQLDRLEKYAAEGGGVVFFLGPLVDGDHYTQKLYREGKGIFPAPLRSTFYPPRSDAPLSPKFTGDAQLLIRDDIYAGSEPFPIFSKVFTSPDQKAFLKELPVFRYFQVPRAQWLKEQGRVFELATLPNDKLAESFQRNIIALTEKLRDQEFDSYSVALNRYVDRLRAKVSPGSAAKSYELANVLEAMLQDKGNKDNPEQFPDLTTFWNAPDPKIRSLKGEVERLLDSARYGDPFIVAQRFGKGRVTAVMSTAGKDWNNWGGGSMASVIYQPFVWEMQNWLSSQGSDANLFVGTPVTIEVDLNRFNKEGVGRVMMIRTTEKPKPGQKTDVSYSPPEFGTSTDKNIQTFTFEGNLDPGFYLSSLYFQDDKNTPLAGWMDTFNVNTATEGKLQRISTEELNKIASGENVRITSGDVGGDSSIINKETDLSESPLFFLIFLLILISEQALAVHLSFHMRGQEGQAGQPMAPMPARAA